MDLTKENFLITGASGFVGACLTRRLVKMGLKVHAVVPVQGDLWRIKDILPSLTLHQGDITDDVFVRNSVRKACPTIIYHLAAHGAYPSQNDAKRILMTNVLGTHILLEALDKLPYKLFVNTGASSEYGFKQKSMQEGDCPEPNSYYAVSKAAQTMLCQYVAKAQKKPIVTFRLFSVYGPYEDAGRLVPTIITRSLRGEALQMADPQTARDFIFVEDVLDAYLNVGRLEACSGEILNIGTGQQTSLKEITAMVLDLTRSPSQVHWKAMQDRIWDSSVWVGDVKRAKELLGWQAKTTLEQGLTQTMEWFKKMNSPVNDLLDTTCAICLTDTHDKEVYSANFRYEDLNPEVFSARRLPDRLHYRMVICHQCGLMRANPVLSLSALSGLYTQSHGHQMQLSQAAADTYNHYFQENFFPLTSEARILEIGCGPGLFLKVLMQQNCLQVNGVEPSREAIEQAGNIKGLIYNGMFAGGIYPRDYFDIICAFQMFDHLADPRQFLRDCRDYLKPEGELFLILHNINALPARILGSLCPMIDIEHPILYSPDTIVKLLEANGFEVKKKFSVINRYPLRYWLQLIPLPLGIKKPLLTFLQKTAMGDIPVRLGLGNMGIIARIKDE